VLIVVARGVLLLEFIVLVGFVVEDGNASLRKGNIPNWGGSKNVKPDVFVVVDVVLSFSFLTSKGLLITGATILVLAIVATVEG